MSSTAERRRYARQDRVGVVEYSGREGVDCTGIVNIGLGGVRLALTGCEQPGTQVQLRISLERGSAPLDLVGQVVWARRSAPYEAGIRFLDIDSMRLREVL